MPLNFVCARFSPPKGHFHPDLPCPTETQDKILTSPAAASFNKKTARNENKNEKQQQTKDNKKLKKQILNKKKIVF